MACPPGKAVRPVMGRVKNAVFNILADRLPGTQVLDLYAGSGSFGIEALSRGAASADFVEREPAHAAVLRENLRALALEDRARLHMKDNRAAFAALAGEGKAFDLILADPPYSLDRKVLQPEVFADLQALAASPVWAPGGILVLDHRGGRPAFPETLAPWLTQQRDYGEATVSFFQRPL